MAAADPASRLTRILGVAPWVIATVCLFTHLPLAPLQPANRDGITFADGIAAYDVTQWRPHWPGYPVLVLAGKAAALATGDPFLALRLLSVICTSVSAILLAGLARTLAEERGATPVGALGTGAAAALLWTAMPVSWLDGTEMFSDPLALALALGMAWALVRGGRHAMPLAGLLGAGVLGARLSYLFLLGPLVVAVLRAPDRAAARRGALGLILGCAAWWAWQLAMDGLGWFQAGWVFLQGFWGDWGGSSLTDPGVERRPARLLYTFLRYPLGAWWPGLPLVRLLPTLFVLLAGGAGLARARGTRTGAVLAQLTLPYLAWIGFAHSVDLARYTMPFAAALVVLLATGLPRRGGAALLAGMVAIYAAIAVPLARKHADIAPLGIQAGRYLEAHLDPRRTTILLSTPSPFLPRYAPAFPVSILEPGREEAQVDALLSAGQTVVATRDMLLGARLALHGWSPLVDLTQDPDVVSRGPWVVHLYARGPAP